MMHRYTNNIMQYNKWITFISLLFVIEFGAGAKNFATINDFNIYFSDNNPQLVAYKNLDDK